MRKVGLIGGMSWHSTVEYYRLINDVVSTELGGHHSARLVLESLDFDQVRALQLAEDWDGAGRLLADAGRRLCAAGADTVLICTNLMHKVAPAVEDAIDVPLLHIGDAVAAQARDQGIDTVGLLGTAWVMREAFYADRLARHGVRTVSPDEADRGLVDRVVFDELTQGVVCDASRAEYVRVIESLAAAGAQAVVLACTEIGLLVRPEDSPIPLIDSAHAHAEAAARFALDRVLTA
ncbi:MAG TPA: amino acid racemase [Nocardioides sp.]|jgi:aspartate racemase|nr:amino acid racemase [Nocardioides sp.]